MPDMLQYLRDNNLTIDLETMNPVEIPKQADAKMEAFFPYPPANVLAKYSLGAQPKPSQFAAAVIVSRVLQQYTKAYYLQQYGLLFFGIYYLGYMLS